MTRRVQLLEVAEAAGHRLATRIDDLRVRKHQVDQPGVAEIVRHLVDEKRPAGDAVVARVAQVGLTERAVLIGRQAGEHAWISCAGLVQVERAHQPWNVGELHRAFDL
jgi:hypothetical protein